MPNWCENRMSVSGSKEAVTKFVEMAKSDKDALSFVKFVPEEWDNPDYQDASTSFCEQLEPNPNFNWYRWRIDNWGVKWDCSDATVDVVGGDEDTVAHFNFTTPWGAPDAFYKKIATMFPDLSFECYGYECGCDYWYHFEGYNGEPVAEETQGIWNQEKVKEAIVEQLQGLDIDPDTIDLDKLREKLWININEEYDISQYPQANFVVENDPNDIAAKCEECKK